MQKKGKIIVTIFGVIGVGVGVYLLSKKYDWFKKSGETDDDDDSGNSGSNRPSYPSTPFTSNVKGDIFRKWVNDTYPKSAKEIDLDPAGTKPDSYNNRWIREAWSRHGVEYQKTFSLIPYQLF
jgi:hypothetical protein